MHYAIIDIETTGGNYRSEKITEIAIYIHDGEKIIDEYASFVNPEKPIPPFITGLTGITNEMVANAPKFFEIAREIVKITEDTIFVAHNANFDYSFIKAEFKVLGYDYNRKTLDTVRLSRKLLPGHDSYSLGKICDDLNIQIKGRHRAAGDALATVKLFEILLSKNEAFDALADPEKFKLLKGIDSEVHRNIISGLPSEIGVYYFYDSDNKLLYIGKSIDIKSRVAQHLRNNTTKSIAIKERLAHVNIEKTGSELVALLLESDEIKKQQPIFNRSQRRSIFSFGLYSRYNPFGYIELFVDKIVLKHGDPIVTFANKAEIYPFMTSAIDKYSLCQKLSGQYQTDGACFYYGIKKCSGACIGEESHSVYNEKVLKFISDYGFQQKTMLIIDQGKTKNESSAIYIKGGKYLGFGSFNNELINDPQEIIDCIKPYSDNRDVQQIIRNYLRNKKFKSIIELT